ncbi:MAG TPA: L,D-transpeptidase [Gammaproteobacteria bacterium]|nr:L,D-transpeptidase [Gammaproteobacteria bacterium]
MNQLAASIEISIPQQTLTLLTSDSVEQVFPVSTALNGPGQQHGSECTPIGRHVVRACIGTGQVLNSVYTGRRPTGEIYSERLSREQPGRDWILTRILWLSGIEPGINRLGDVDTMRRFIYIHGTPYENQIGTPVSKGCIRMRNVDIIELFDKVVPGTAVNITN